MMFSPKAKESKAFRREHHVIQSRCYPRAVGPPKANSVEAIHCYGISYVHLHMSVHSLFFRISMRTLALHVFLVDLDGKEAAYLIN